MKHSMMFDVNDFPDVMRDFAKIGGIMQTLLYAHSFGGVDFYMQKWKIGKTPNNEIVNMLSMYLPHHVENICKLYGGNQVHIKRCMSMMKIINDAEIVSLSCTGMLQREVARATKSSMRHVRQVCNG